MNKLFCLFYSSSWAAPCFCKRSAGRTLPSRPSISAAGRKGGNLLPSEGAEATRAKRSIFLQIWTPLGRPGRSRACCSLHGRCSHGRSSSFRCSKRAALYCGRRGLQRADGGQTEMKTNASPVPLVFGLPSVLPSGERERYKERER